MSLTVRPAVPSDAAAFAEIHVRAWQVAYRGIVDQALIDRLDVAEKTVSWEQGIREPRDGARITVCEHDGRVAAWSTHGPCHHQPPAAHGTGRPEGELMGLYAHPDAWGTGAGPAVLADALAWLDGRYASSVLWVLSGNPRAIACYRRHGYVAVVERVITDQVAGAPLTMMRRTRSR